MFINERGRLTIVECKLWKNPEAWGAEFLRSFLRNFSADRCAIRGADCSAPFLPPHRLALLLTPSATDYVHWLGDEPDPRTPFATACHAPYSGIPNG